VAALQVHLPGKECYCQEIGYVKFISSFELCIFLVSNNQNSLWIINLAINQVCELVIYLRETYRVNEGKTLIRRNFPPPSVCSGREAMLCTLVQRLEVTYGVLYMLSTSFFSLQSFHLF
jgi:hypothetical protein